MPEPKSKRSTPLIVLVMLLAMVGVSAVPVRAQDATPSPAPVGGATLADRLPGDRRTRHTITIAGRTLAFAATAGSIPIETAEGELLADVGYFAYTLEGADPRTRPVVFAYNGGPGSSSVWLHIGALGPWRVPLTVETMASRMPPGLVDNAETWLDFADLVFIDPPGTGHSRIAPSPSPTQGPARGGGEIVRSPDGGRTVHVRRAPSRRTGGPDWFWSLEGDIATFAEAITAWLRRTGRQRAPVVLAGESYGGFRTPLIARLMAQEHNIPVRAMVLVSPVLDFDGRRGGYLPQHYTSILPSIVATRMERTGTVPTRERLLETEAYARTDYLADLVRGPRDAAALQRIGERAGSLTGLMAEHVRHLNGRISPRAFVVDNPLFDGQNVSLYDAGMADIPVRRSRERGFGDHFTSALDPPLGTAMGQLIARLDWKTGRQYLLMSPEINSGWTWRNSPHPPESLSVMQRLMSADPGLRALVTHGFTDLVTPYFATAGQLDLLSDATLHRRIHFEVYPGGHMFYSRDASRFRLREDAARLIAEVLVGSAQGNRQDNRMSRGETP